MSFCIRTVAASLTALSLCAAPALADTFTVSPNGALPTIQAGVDAAGPGDTVKVSAGYYLENVSIPADKDGLRLQGKGKVVLDAHPSSGEGSGPGLFIEADDVTIQGLTIRNAAAGDGKSGYGILTLGSGLTVLKSRIESCVDGGVRSDSVNSLTVLGSSFFACGDAAVFADGKGTRVEKCLIRSCDAGVLSFGMGARLIGNTIESVSAACINLESDGALVSRNTIRGSASNAIQVSGESVHIERNRISLVYASGIEVSGPDALIEKNQLTDIDSDGINAQGSALRVLNNRLTGLQGFGIRSDGADALLERNTVERAAFAGIDHVGIHPTITRNTVRDVFGGDHGIDVANGDSGLVTDNRVAHTSGCGIRVGDGSVDVLIEDNAIDGAGAHADGIRVEGNGHAVRGNLIRGAGRDGLHADGAQLLLVDNRIGDCAEDGIDLEGGSDVEIRGNQVNDCGAEGIENGGLDTTIVDNKSLGNRTDFAGSEDALTMQGNQSGDGSDAEPGKAAIDS